jgi:hypothetical protein
LVAGQDAGKGRAEPALTGSVVAPRNSGIARALRNWCAPGLVLFLLLLGQWVLFHQTAMKNVVWTYPRGHDQASYLRTSYVGYERIQESGLLRGSLEMLGCGPQPLSMSPNGPMLPLEAALAYRAFGPGRLRALSVNFFYWALLQIATVAAARRLSGNWNLPVLGLGLLLTTGSPFYIAGGLYDFRLDLGVMCLFGTFISLVVCSGFFASLWRSLLVGLCGAYLGAFRFITLPYLAGIFALYGAWLAVRLVRNAGENDRRRLARQLTGMALAAALITAMVAPLLWRSRGAIYDYYFLKHLVGNERDIRAVHAGVTSLASALSFYPRSVLKIHLGEAFAISTANVLAMSVCLRLFVGGRKPAGAGSDGGNAFILICIVVPLVLLTFDHDKSDVVGSVFFPPILWVVLLAADRLIRSSAHVGRYAMAAVACFALAFGIDRQPHLYARAGRLPQDHQSLEGVNELYDEIASVCRERHWLSPRMATDCHADWLAPATLSVLAFERSRLRLDAREMLARLDRYPDANAIFDCLSDCDFVVLTEGPTRLNQYPFDLQMTELRPWLRDWCDTNRKLLLRTHLFDRNVTVYIR